jgi:hypothetical protein
MAQEYQPRRFFRNAPNHLLQRYFAARNVLTEVGFDALTETQVEPIYEAWLKLPDDARKEMEQDFQEIDELATEGGSKAILDEARWHGEDLAAQFASLTGFHEHAFWTFLERPFYWQGALAFHHADAVPFSHWRKRKNVPRIPTSVDAVSIRRLERNLSDYFHKMQGRGENCKVECYKRNDLDCFFAYPEDYAQASVEWIGGEFNRRPRYPAFEIIFVYSQKDGTLDTYLSGDRKPVPDLQEIFANSAQQHCGIAPCHEPARGGRTVVSARARNRRGELWAGSTHCRDCALQPRPIVPGREPPRGGRAFDAEGCRNTLIVHGAGGP